MSVGILYDRVWKGYCVTNKKRGTKLHEEKSIQGSTALHIANLCRILIFRNVLWISDAEHGISMLDKYQNVGWKKFYLIYGMCDETFSINYTSEIPEDIDRGWFYWIAKKTPEYIQYLGKFLPSAVFGMLVIYCLKNVEVLHGTHGIPEGISILVTAVLHIWKKNMFLSIAGGTICYMLILYFL